MKTSVIEVHDMLSVFSVVGVEKRIGEVPGVESVTVNYATESATVRYDETRLGVADIKSAVRQSEYESGAPAGSAGEGHEAHKAAAANAPSLVAAPATSSAPVATPKSSTVAQEVSAPAAPKSAPNADAPVAPAANETKDKDKK